MPACTRTFGILGKQRNNIGIRRKHFFWLESSAISKKTVNPAQETPISLESGAIFENTLNPAQEVFPQPPDPRNNPNHRGFRHTDVWRARTTHTEFAGAARAGGRCYCSRLPARPVRRSAVEVRSSCAPVSRPHGPQTARERTARGGRGAAHSDPLTRRSSARDLLTMVLDVQTGTNCATFRTIGDRDTAPCGVQAPSQNDRGQQFQCRLKSSTVRVFACRLLDQLQHDGSYPCV